MTGRLPVLVLDPSSGTSSVRSTSVKDTILEYPSALSDMRKWDWIICVRRAVKGMLAANNQRGSQEEGFLPHCPGSTNDFHATETFDISNIPLSPKIQSCAEIGYPYNPTPNDNSMEVMAMMKSASDQATSLTSIPGLLSFLNSLQTILTIPDYRKPPQEQAPAMSEKSTKLTGKILSAKPTTAQPRSNKGKNSSTWDNVGTEQALSDIATLTSLFSILTIESNDRVLAEEAGTINPLPSLTRTEKKDTGLTDNGIPSSRGILARSLFNDDNLR
ncbi:hypothetical protein BP00DRAFT_416002 [Aspergillus indologenus CBS 114.80]|uniref:Uncharacterized protein n=1 Tax=Aspergillus indologenus CBS 114.80 TaxID=1450541 RepID=A0A2V5IQQ7_9EURO|nr:hypothetical protein BP00DRAFT_416002 [Aspergillus indologenus CBS 114.80]